MPKELEMKLKQQAHRKGFKGKKANAYVYGTLRKTGWVPSTQRKDPGFYGHLKIQTLF